MFTQNKKRFFHVPCLWHKIWPISEFAKKSKVTNLSSSTGILCNILASFNHGTWFSGHYCKYVTIFRAKDYITYIFIINGLWYYIITNENILEVINIPVTFYFGHAALILSGINKQSINKTIINSILTIWIDQTIKKMIILFCRYK